MPDEYSKFEPSEFEKSLARMGNEVEKLARGMFPDGYLIERRGEGSQELTQKLIRENHPVIFQAAFPTSKYFVASDVLQWNSDAKKYDLYEIKMSTTEDDDDDDFDASKPKRVNKKKELQYEYDLAFQSNVIEECGVPLNKKFLIRLNREYVRSGDLDFTQGKLFIVEDKTEAINALAPIAKEEMESAYRNLSSEEMPTWDHGCFYKGRNAHCTAFSFITKVPEYSVHDLNRIGKSPKLLKGLIDEGYLSISEVPETFEGLLSKPTKDNPNPKPRKLNQIKVHKSNEPIIDLDALKAELDTLQFPLYFLDYETYPTAIPPYSGYRPFQHIVFQYSLHVLDDKESEPRHLEHIVLNGDPSMEIAQRLSQDIGNTGTVISWFKKFENSRNKELSKMLIEQSDRDFFLGLVERTYDLMDIVENQYYIHPGFEGRSSIKKVLPVIAKLSGREAELSYKKLAVKNGTDAIEAYRKINEGEISGEDLENKKSEMLEYCKLDTYGMYVIWKFFNDLVK